MLKKNLARAGRMSVAGAVAASLMGIAGVAVAATVTVEDAPADMGHPADIQQVTVVNGKSVKVRVRHDDLRRKGTVGAAVFVDTNPDRKGPEYVFTSGLSAGSDYTLARARRWQPSGEPLTCAHDLRLDYAEDLSVFTMGRTCLGSPEEVRIAVRVRAYSEEAGMQRDWLTGLREWTEWVPRG